MQVRSHIVQVLEGSEHTHSSPNPAPDTYLLNELIREYLDFHGYDATKSVFCKESQLAHEAFPRSFLEARVGLSSGLQASRLPALYSLLRRQDRDSNGAQL
jgi:FOP N terminal dimerisation domain